MNQTDMQLLFDHLYWMRNRVLAAADAEAAPWSEAAPPTIRDLRTTLVHELDVEWSWRERLRRADPTEFGAEAELNPADFDTLDSLRRHWVRDEAEMREWLGTLTDDRLNEPCRAERQPDAPHPFWYHLQHLYTHGIQQFSDAAVLLTKAGRSPGELDFLDFIESRER